jgi:hypothetical protein
MESIARELFEHAQIKSDHTLALTVALNVLCNHYLALKNKLA